MSGNLFSEDVSEGVTTGGPQAVTTLSYSQNIVIYNSSEVGDTGSRKCAVEPDNWKKGWGLKVRTRHSTIGLL